MFVAKKIVTLTRIQMINNKKQRNFEKENKNFMQINVNITYFWLILKKIQMRTLMMGMKKQIIQMIMTKA